MNNLTVHDPLRLSVAETDRLLAQLNRAGAGQSKRRHRRWLMSRQKGVLSLTNDKGNHSAFVIVPRNISRGGVAVLHGGFVHCGTRCTLGLRGADGAPRSMPATVVRCRCVEGRVHDLGIVFDQEVNPRDFAIRAMDEFRFDTEAVDPRTLSGKVLVVSSNASDAEFIDSVFDGSGVEVRAVGTGANGLARLDDATAAAFVSATLPDTTGLEWMKSARSERTLSVVLIADEADAERRENALAEGASECVTRPLSDLLVVQAVADATSRTPEDEDLVRAARCVPPGLLPEDADRLMSEFRHLGRELGKAVESDDPLGAEQAAKALRWALEGTGFEVLLSAARQAHDGLAQRKKIAPVMAPLRRVIRLCEHMRPDAPPTGASGGVATELAA